MLRAIVVILAVAAFIALANGRVVKRVPDVKECVQFLAKSHPRGKYGGNPALATEVCKFMETWFDGTSTFKPTKAQSKWFNSLSSTRAENVPNAPGVRKEVRTLTAAERKAFATAVLALKGTEIDGVNQYDIFVYYHKTTISPEAHGGAAFYVFHREFLYRFEKALQLHDPSVHLPYWDSTLDFYLPVPADSVMWHEDFFGGSGIPVASGPYSHFSITPDCVEPDGKLELTREVGLAGEPFEDGDVEWVFSKTDYQGITGRTNSRFEADHGTAHLFVGGNMGNVQCSPSDPSFWTHHSFVDSVWEEFRQKYQTTDLEKDYPTSADGDIGGPNHEPTAPMLPFEGMTNIDGLSLHYTRDHYTYAPRPFACAAQADCGGENLWCDTPIGRCKSKIVPGGSCAGVHQQHLDDACYSTSVCNTATNTCGTLLRFKQV